MTFAWYPLACEPTLATGAAARAIAGRGRAVATMPAERRDDEAADRRAVRIIFCCGKKKGGAS